MLALAFPLVGSLIATRRAGNLVGWVLLLAGIALLAEALLRGYAELALLAKPEADLPAGMVAAAIGGGAWTLLMASVFLLLLLFPGGKAPSQRWERVAWLVLCGFAAVWVAIATSPGLDPPFEGFENPLAFSSDDSYLVVAFALVGLCLIAVAAAAIDLLMRFWRSRGDEREQYKWLAFAGCFLIVSLPLALLTNFENGVAGAMIFIALISLPISVGIAVLKYRLYEIDVIINRTLVYVPMTAILAGLFVASTTLVRTVFTDLTDAGSDISVAASTIGVVALLTPLKNKLQSIVDRYFKEEREPLVELRRTAKEARSVLQVMDLNRLLARLLDSARRGLDAEGAALVSHVADGVLLTSGDWYGNVRLNVPLHYDDSEVGSLVLGPRQNGRPYTALDEAALKETAEALAMAISLASVRIPETVTRRD